MNRNNEMRFIEYEKYETFTATIIGTVNGKSVIYNRINRTVIISGTNIMISGVVGVNHAIETAFRNFSGFVVNKAIV